MKLTPTFSIGETVWHRCDTECPGIVTGYLVRSGGHLLYLVCWGGEETSHYEFELTDERPIDGVNSKQE